MVLLTETVNTGGGPDFWKKDTRLDILSLKENWKGKNNSTLEHTPYEMLCICNKRLGTHASLLTVLLVTHMPVARSPDKVVMCSHAGPPPT